MSCTSCQAARETQGHWRMYDSPKCIYCTARLIQKIARLPVDKDESIARRRAVLADAVAWGHAEKAIRDLSSSKEMALAPVEGKRK